MLALSHARYIDLLGRARTHLAIQYGRHYPSPWGDNYVTLRALLARAPSRTLLPLGYNTLNPYFFIYFSSPSHDDGPHDDERSSTSHRSSNAHLHRIYFSSTSTSHVLLIYFLGYESSNLLDQPVQYAYLFRPEVTKTCARGR